MIGGENPRIPVYFMQARCFPYFDAVVLQKIENDYHAIANLTKKPQRTMQVAVENFTELSL